MRRELTMVELTRSKPIAVFRVLDREGQPIGAVVQPTCAPVLGCGAGTILLVRDPAAMDPRLRACA